MIDIETIQIIVLLVGVLVSPIYALLFWRIKVSTRIESKLSKLCMAFKLEHPQYTELLK